MKINAVPIVIAIVLIVGAVALTAIPIDAVYTSSTDSSSADEEAKGGYTTMVELLDGDGEPVQVTPYRIMSFYYESTAVTKLRVTVSWDIQGTNLDYDTLSLNIHYAFYRDDIKPVLETDATPSEQNVIGEGEGSFQKDFALSNLLSTEASQTLHVQVTIDVSVKDTFGATLTDQVSDSVSIPFSYVKDEGTLSVTGGIGYTPMDGYSGVLSVMPTGFFLFGGALLFAGICVMSKR